MEEILNQTAKLEKIYDWLGAAQVYEKSLKLLYENDFSGKAENCERLGYALFRAAFQAENNEEFRDRLHQSTMAYEKAAESYEKLQEPVRTPRTLRCNAMIAYAGYWLASEAKEKKIKIDECWTLTKKALAAFNEAHKDWEYGKTHNQLSSSVVFAFSLNWDFQARQKMITEAVESGEQAIKFLSASEDLRELARAYARTAYWLGLFDYQFLDLDVAQRDSEKIQHYWQKAKELSEDVAMSEFLYPVFGAQFLLWGDGTEEAFTNLNRALEYGGKARDRFVTGCVFDWLVYHKNWQASTKFDEDPQERSTRRETILRYAEDALQQYAPLSFISPRGDARWIEMIRVDHYHLSSYDEMDLEKRRDLREKAREGLPDGLKRAEASGSPEAAFIANHMSGYVLFGRADVETNSEVKKKLLEEGLRHEQEAARLTDKFHPFQRWDRGIMQMMPGWAESQLADLAQDPETRKNMLLKSLAHRENGLRLCIEHTRVFEKQVPANFWSIGGTQYEIGGLLNRLYEATSNEEHLRKAAGFLAEAAESYRKVDAKNRIAEAQWRTAMTYDGLGEHLKAAEYFDLASENYRSVSERISQTETFYLEHASYMAAWSEIEKARQHHKRQEYGLAKEHFEKAADLHKLLRKWSYLAPNYCAWVNVEYAEDMSRKEQCEEAIQSFKEAIKRFDEAKKSIQNELSKIGDNDEKRMANSMAKATDMRNEYCAARIAIEEAKILDKKGDHYSSSERYGSAADVFEKMIQELPSEQDREELRIITSLSRAWQKMTLAEAESSSELYLEASQLFEQARGFSSNEKTKMLVLGHSRFCKALEAGTRYADSRDATLHQIVERHLESASDYYVKAGFQNASEYSKAMEYLFDAYLYMDDAKREKDPEKKAKLYTMVEKILQTSAGSFMKAEHPEKSAQVTGLLDKTREEKELALSLTEVLHAPSIVSTTTAFMAPTPNQEDAVGLERFESADIQANLIIRQKELKVGEPLNLEIELVNAGKGPALLVKVNKAIPEGFELGEKPETCRVEDSYIDLKGKRLGPLKTEELKLVLKPKVQGTFALKPTILYLDENGKYKSHEPEPVSIVVKELGIKGWLKGER